MRKIILIIGTLFVSYGFCLAQGKVKIENIDVTQEQDINDNASLRNAVYIFPEFSDGVIYFKNRTVSSGKFNYNTLNGEMQFLDNEKILSLAKPQDVAYAVINKKVFYYVSDTNFAELLVDNNTIKLCVKRSTKLADIQAKGAYGITKHTTTVKALVPTQQYELGIIRDLVYKINDEFLLENNGKFSKISNTKSFVKAFPQFKAEIERFVTSNKTDFKNEKDLIKLTNYCTQLSTIKK